MSGPMNPYESPPPVPAPELAAAPPPTSLAWFAGTLAALLAAISLLFAFFILGYRDLLNLFVRTLVPTAIYSVVAVIVCTIVRQLPRFRVGFASTRGSQIAAAVVAAAYIAVMHFVAMQSASELIVMLFGLLLSFPVGIVVCFTEQAVARRGDGGTPRQPHRGSVTETMGVSWLWFAATALLLGTLAYLRSSPSVLGTILGALSAAAVVCFVATILYAGLNVCVPRHAPPTRASRIAAAALFIILVAAFDLVFNVYGGPPPLYRMLFCVPMAAAAVFVDRMIARGGAARAAS